MSLYRQEGNIGQYQAEIPCFSCNNGIKKYLSPFGPYSMYIKDRHLVAFFNVEKMNGLAKEFLELAKDDTPNDWKVARETAFKSIDEKAWEIANLDLKELGTDELYEHFEILYKHAREMWDVSIFLDTLDVGQDLEEVNKRVRNYGFKDSEVDLLLTPRKSSYIGLWSYQLSRYLDAETSYDELFREFFWYATGFISYGELTDEFIESEKVNANSESYTYPKEEVQKILEKYNLKENPLRLFQDLVEWRDDRKRYHYTALYGIFRIFFEVANRYGIEDTDSLNFLRLGEERSFFDGQISSELLSRRASGTVLFTFEADGTISHLENAEADKLFKELEDEHALSEEVSGNVACRGKVTGVARIVHTPNEENINSFKEGEILVTPMTRPEFLPLMKKAAAIVTDEGGISCHAAIVSRELGVPCIIGTQNATHILTDGEEVEVDAENGLVKMLS